MHYVPVLSMYMGVSACGGKWLLHVVANVHLMWPGPIVCGAITEFDPRQCSQIISVWGFLIPPAVSQDVCPLRLAVWPSNSPDVVISLSAACVVRHMLSLAVKSSHDKCCSSVYEMMLASHFKPPLSFTVDCTALAKSILWACGAIIQRQEDI